MKKLLLATATVVALMSVVPVQATPAPPVPEPSSLVQLAAGLFVLGGLALVARKRVFREDAD